MVQRYELRALTQGGMADLRHSIGRLSSSGHLKHLGMDSRPASAPSRRAQKDSSRTERADTNANFIIVDILFGTKVTRPAKSQLKLEKVCPYSARWKRFRSRELFLLGRELFRTTACTGGGIDGFEYFESCWRLGGWT